MKVLVTGSSGFVGAALCRALCAQGHAVSAFHRPTSNLKLLEDLPVSHVLGDLTQPASLESAVEGMDAVFHAGAQLGSAPAARMYAVTVEGTRALLQAALDAGVKRFVHTSSAAALGIPAPAVGGRRILMDENHAWNYRPDYWPYGYAKYLAELEVQKAVARGLDAVILNPSVVLGAGDLYRQSSSIVVQTARRRIPVLIEGGVNVVHIEDVTTGHLAAWDRGRAGERYLLTGENLSVPDFIRKIAAIAGVPAPAAFFPAGLARGLAGWIKLAQPFLNLAVTPDQLRQAGQYFYFDNRRSREILGMEEPRPADEAIRAAYDWFKAAGAIP